MRIDIVFPKLPPSLDGIGDYTKQLAESLAQCGQQVRVLTAQEQVTQIGGVETVKGFSIDTPSGVRALSEAVGADVPNWLILQYNPFSYGRWGLNLWLPEVVSELKRDHVDLRIAVMVHEPFVPVERWQFAVMTVWQRWQLWRLGHLADLVFCAIEPWTQTLCSYTGKDTALVSLPVGSNIIRSTYSKQKAREDLNIGNDELVIGVFGSTTHRRKGLIKAAVNNLAKTAMDVRVLYVGTDGTVMKDLIGDIGLFDVGPASNLVVSKALSAMDIHLAPYPRGVSARRGSFIAGLQHGLPTVSTSGGHTDPFISDGSGDAFILAPDLDSGAYSQAVCNLAIDEQRRLQMMTLAEDFYNKHFRWEDIAKKMVTSLEDVV